MRCATRRTPSPQMTKPPVKPLIVGCLAVHEDQISPRIQHADTLWIGRLNNTRATGHRRAIP
jgi:hypothetical protein